jgi:hypothetical protein
MYLLQMYLIVIDLEEESVWLNLLILHESCAPFRVPFVSVQSEIPES